MMVRLYRESDATATLLAEKYQVSPSTVTRILKDNIPAKDYQSLVSQKRSAGRRRDEASSTDQLTVLLDDTTDSATADGPSTSGGEGWLDVEPVFEGFDDDDDPSSELESARTDDDYDRGDNDTSTETPLSTAFFDDGDDDESDDESDDDFDLDDIDTSTALYPESEEDPDDESDFDDDDGYESELDFDDYDSEADENVSDDQSPEAALPEEEENTLQVLSLEDLDPPDVCYTVIDRFHELTTQPLRDLGSDSGTEQMDPESRMLPIFDSHRFARRFSEMNKRRGNPPHRVIQFPGYLLDIVRSHLRGKGITHLLVDGKVYSL